MYLSRSGDRYLRSQATLAGIPVLSPRYDSNDRHIAEACRLYAFEHCEWDGGTIGLNPGTMAYTIHRGRRMLSQFNSKRRRKP